MKVFIRTNPNGHPMEDHCSYIQIRTPNMWVREVFCAAVADGVGSCFCSAETSKRAVQLLFRSLTERLTDDRFLRENEDEQQHQFFLWADTAISEINKTICDEYADRPGIGTTLSFALVYGNYVVTASCGDSPVYLLSSNGAIQLLLPLDHLPDRKNQLTQCLGSAETDQWMPHITAIYTAPGDRLLLGSDGAFGQLSEAEILSLSSEAAELSGLAHIFLPRAAETTADNQALALLEF